jgi:hypothetical protein
MAMVTVVLFTASTLIITSSTLIPADFEYIGAAKCKICHNKPATGEQYNKWLATPHANAMKSLSNEKSLAFAKENGIADPAKEPSCVKCHSTAGATDPNLHAGITQAEGVSCETCHGPGSMYKSNTIMQDRAKSLANGMIIPDQKLCETCHNPKNPFHKPFNYQESLKKISHPNPAKAQ